MNMTYCMDCGHYIPGGSERNCNAAEKTILSSVCPLKEACNKFIPRDTSQDEIEKQRIIVRARKPKRKPKDKWQ